MDKCLGIVEEWANLSLQCEPYISEYGKYQKRCQFAVKLAAHSRRVKGDARLMMQMINHHTKATIQDLRGVNFKKTCNPNLHGTKALHVMDGLRAATGADQDCTVAAATSGTRLHATT